MQDSSFSIPPSGDHPTLSSAMLRGVRSMRGDHWLRLVQTFGPIVYRWCRTSGVPQHDAPDVVQDVFASVARGIEQFERQKKEGSFRSWLATITRNRTRDYFRRQMGRERAEGGTDALQRISQQIDDLDSTVSVASVQGLLVRSVAEEVQAEFEPSTWQAFWKVTVEGRVPADVADQLGLSVASVYQAKSRVLRRLRRRLDELPD